MTEQERDKPIFTAKQVVGVVGLILFVWATPIFVIWFFKVDVNKAGPFGDVFGTVNALFTAAAFGGVIYTVLLQKRELSLQRDELELTREELTRTANAQEKSEKALNKQAESLLLAAQLNALMGRITVYDHQIATAQERRKSGIPYTETENPVQRMIGERHTLYQKLDKLLQKSFTLGD